jgi:His/Glu/Gln/Arg/opine family amino acid ABC transporter permease subunit
VLDFAFIRDNWLFIAGGVTETLAVAVFAFVLAIPLAMLVARGRQAALLPIKALSAVYVWLIDGIPLLVQIFFIFLVLPRLGIVLPGFWAGVSVLAVYYSARMSGLFLAAPAAAGKGPEELRNSLIPPLAHQLTDMIKDSTIISVTGFLHDVLWRAQRVGRAEFHVLEALIMAAIIYLVLFTVVSLGGRLLRITMAGSKPGTQVPG